jgi:hypothetical protein
MSRSPKWPFRFSPRVDFCNDNIWQSIQIKKLLIMQFSPDSHYFLPLRSKCFLHLPVLCTKPLAWNMNRIYYAHMERLSAGLFCRRDVLLHDSFFTHNNHMLRSEACWWSNALELYPVWIAAKLLSALTSFLLNAQYSTLILAMCPSKSLSTYYSPLSCSILYNLCSWNYVIK